MKSFPSSLVIVGLLICAGCRPPGQPTEADIELKPDQVRDFAVLYAQNCAGCHGKDGSGNSAFALANPIYLAIASEDTLRRGTAQGVPGSLMPAFAKSAGGTLTDEQIDIIVREIRTRWVKAADVAGANPPPYTAKEPGNAGHGKGVFATFCAGCHGAEGRGTAKGSSIVDESFLRLVTDQNLRTTIIAGRPDLGHPDWRHYLPDKEMSPHEVTDVVAWLASNRNANSNAPYASNEPTKKNN
jgi:cytochrome c oxidase cbb3-type subunit 3/ubiquinol-cytochrome c reductase cytochrome c subunit